MNCPKCSGLLMHEEIQVHSGRFRGWRCIQCGLRLDERIAQNRLATPPGSPSDDDDDPPIRCSTTIRSRLHPRSRRAAGKP